MFSFLEQPFAIVDIETTGTSNTNDGITEIAVIYNRGEELVRWSSLLNPGRSISPMITRLTGIDDAMVADAPVFADIAADLHDLLQDRLFIAHNAPFDYGFLRYAFEHWGVVFNPPTLCTVRLARKLFPEEYRHNLDSLVQRFRLQAKERHRAMADADLVWQLLMAFEDRQTPDYLSTTVKKLIKPSRF